MWDNDIKAARILLATYIGEISVTDRPEFKGRGSYQTLDSVSTTPQGYKNHNCVMNSYSTTLQDNGYFSCTHHEPETQCRTRLHYRTRLIIVPQPTVNPECNLNKHGCVKPSCSRVFHYKVFLSSLLRNYSNEASHIMANYSDF